MAAEAAPALASEPVSACTNRTTLSGPVALDRRPTSEASSSGRAWGSRRRARYEERTARSYGFHPVEWYAPPATNARLCAEIPWRLAVREGREVEEAGWGGTPRCREPRKPNHDHGRGEVACGRSGRFGGPSSKAPISTYPGQISSGYASQKNRSSPRRGGAGGCRPGCGGTSARCAWPAASCWPSF